MPNQQYQQTYPNSCGASCLLCAAIELGTNQLPPTPAYPLWALGISPLATNRTGELALYSVTCGKGGGVAPLPTDGYSMPSHIYDACTAMGRTASAYVPSSLIGALLQLVYRDDVARARNSAAWSSTTPRRQRCQAPTSGC